MEQNEKKSNLKGKIMKMLAETFVHTGTGHPTSIVDCPVARETITSYPFIPSTSLKGSLRGLANENVGVNSNITNKKVDKYFGSSDSAGKLLISDARLLLLPVRSLLTNYRWITCPYILERLKRDLKRLGIKYSFTIPEVTRGKTLSCVNEQYIFLEERQFEKEESEGIDNLANLLSAMIPDDDVRNRLKDQLVILHNDDFKWFANFGLEIRARNILNSETKSSRNLWYEEYISSDTLMYCLVFSEEDGIDFLDNLLTNSCFLQIGGNETVGQGWFHVKLDYAEKIIHHIDKIDADKGGE
ncbi:MAG: type III-B CRISPR module RAMP protein Cmr4 [Candidatus Heimdallarchaeum aukensis]|uniref:Type III-B CRISPR module RAMP protein Cmr4 n=1 Tax=Candidatus Heimdallarchaeum aukensis TaxID=2876573 RepID=A0A9Y1BLT2_9ARCH|nr:MAG: type III-B CRISPR module RAMP protein Cmr4 [Candidatus Heimdallarchaeum aukensis]